MDKTGRPCGKSDSTMKREFESEEKSNPETRQRRMEDETFRRINFFTGHVFFQFFPAPVDVPVLLSRKDGRPKGWLG